MQKKGRRTPDWLELFRKYPKAKILHLQHLKLLTGMKPRTLQVALRRLTQRKVIRRICRGYYANPFTPPTLEEISAQIYKPSYISLEFALYRHGVLSQAPHVLTCVTPRLPRTFRTALGTILYRQIKREFFFGFVREGEYFLAEPEKAFVDYLYLRRGREIPGTHSEWNDEELQPQRLRSYAKRLGVKLHR